MLFCNRHTINFHVEDDDEYDDDIVNVLLNNVTFLFCPCVKPRLLTYFASESARAFKLEKRRKIAQ